MSDDHRAFLRLATIELERRGRHGPSGKGYKLSDFIRESALENATTVLGYSFSEYVERLQKAAA